MEVSKHSIYMHAWLFLVALLCYTPFVYCHEYSNRQYIGLFVGASLLR